MVSDIVEGMVTFEAGRQSKILTYIWVADIRDERRIDHTTRLGLSISNAEEMGDARIILSEKIGPTVYDDKKRHHIDQSSGDVYDRAL